MRRNQAIHEGAEVEKPEVDRAFDEAKAIVAHVKMRLESSEDLKAFGVLLALDVEGDGGAPQWEQEPLGIRFPWD